MSAVYLAGPYAARDLIKGWALELDQVDIGYTSSWLDEDTTIDSTTTGAAAGIPDDQVRRHVEDDLADIRQADALVLFTPATVGMAPIETLSGGRHVETGYAMALNLPVLIVGKPENVFHRHPEHCTVVADWHQALLQLVRWHLDGGLG